MALWIDQPSSTPATPGKSDTGWWAGQPQTVLKPGGQSTGSLNPPPVRRGQSDAERAASRAAAAAAAAESKAKKAGKDQSARENKATQEIIDTILKGLKGYAAGRDTQLANAATALEAALAGIQANYQGAVADYNKTAIANEQDEASKSAANLTNRARERMSLLEQAASQGAGETDQLRAQLQSYQNFDANALEISRSFNDTQRSIQSQIAGANNQAETSRRSAWQTNQEQRGQAWNDFYKNYTDAATNAQRVAAQNSNIDSDYSTGFNPNFGGLNIIDEASKYVGKTYKNEDKDEEWFRNFEGRTEGRNKKLNSANRAASTTISAPKSAEGATLRGKR